MDEATKLRGAVILARGLGTRMRRAEADGTLDARQAAAARSGAKAMMPFGRPFLDYVISAVADAGCSRVCLVVGPEHDAFRDYYTGPGRPTRLEVAFAVQAMPRGTADAVLAAEAWADGGEFLVLNSDNLYPTPALRDLVTLDGAGVVAFSRAGLLRDGQIEASRIHAFAVVDIGPDGWLRRIVEKPDAATLSGLGPDPLVSMNCWRLTPAVFDACRHVPLSPRGEVELPAAVQLAVDEGTMPVRVVRSDLAVLDLSSRGDVATVAARLQSLSARP